ncbi:MAG: LysR family transcriptional regulator [Alphaproteobacteria bacterium]
MDHLSRIGIFIKVVKNTSFAGAARELGITSSAVSKQVQNLEFELQTKLLNRTTRNVSVTEEGAIFFERASRAMEDLQEAKEQIHELKSCPHGTLKVSIPFSVGIKYLGKAIASFAKQYPDVNLDLSFDDRYVDISAEGFDLAIRIGALQDSSLISRRLASCPIYICASPEYIGKHGIPQHPKELADHNVLAYTRNQGSHEWRYKDQNGKEGHVKLQGTFKCDTGEMMREAVIKGVGIAILPIFYIAEPLKEGLVKQILPEYISWPNRDIHAVFMPNRYLSTRLRLFVDHITLACKSLPWSD